jgi:hypothetical protein
MLKLFALKLFVDTFNLLLVFSHKVFLKTMNGYPHDENYSQSQRWIQNSQEMLAILFMVV